MMPFHDKETPPPRYSSPCESLLPQYTTDIPTSTEPQPTSQPQLLTLLRILRGIFNLCPRLFLYFCVFYAALTVFWTVDNPNAITTAPFTSTPITAKELANTVLVAWVMGWVKVYLGFMRRAMYRGMWRQEFEYTLEWAGFDTCVGGLVAVVVVPFVMMNWA